MPAATNRCLPAASACSAQWPRVIQRRCWRTSRRTHLFLRLRVELKLPETLRQVGHKYHEVASLSELRASVETGRFNIIVADLGDVADLERNLGSSASVALVPVAYKLTKAETREAAKQRRFLINASGKEVYYLRTITDAVRSVNATSRKG